MKKLLKYFLALLVLLFMLTLIEVLCATAGYAAMKYPACVHYGTRTLIITSLCAFFMAFVWLLAGGSARSHGRTARSITALGTVTAFLALLWIAALGMFGGQGLTKIPRAFREKLKGEEFPLAYIGGLAIADDGRIYLSNQQYGTIQAYKNNGVFLRSWFVETCGNYEIWIKDGRLSTYEHRTHYKADFTLDGVLISREEIQSPHEILRLSAKGAALEALDSNGSIYKVKNPEWSPKVTRTDAKDPSEVIIQTPASLQFLTKNGRVTFFFKAFLTFCCNCLLWRVLRQIPNREHEDAKLRSNPLL